jgi:hypothetical protein
MNNDEFKTGVENHKKNASPEDILNAQMVEKAAEIGFLLNLLTVLEDALECHGTLEMAIRVNEMQLNKVSDDAEAIARLIAPNDLNPKITPVGFGDMEATGNAIMAKAKASKAEIVGLNGQPVTAGDEYETLPTEDSPVEVEGEVPAVPPEA